MNTKLVISLMIALVLVAFGSIAMASAQTETPVIPENTFSQGMNGNRGARGGMMGGWRSAGVSPAGMEGPLHDYMLTAISNVFGVTPEELQGLHDAGTTMWDFAQQKGMTQEQFLDLMLQARTQALEKAVADGIITQEQADWMLSRWSRMGNNGAGICTEDGVSRGNGGRWNNQPVEPLAPDA